MPIRISKGVGNLTCFFTIDCKITNLLLYKINEKYSIQTHKVSVILKLENIFAINI